MRAAIDRQGLGALLAIAVITALVAVVYAGSFGSMIKLWQNSDHHHGMFVFPIAAYLLWRLRVPLGRIPLQPWAWGTSLLAALVLVWLLAIAISVQAIEHLAVILLIPTAVATILGTSLVRRALFPLLFLVAAVPVGDALIPHLMRITADVSATMLRAVDVPVFRDGQLMTLPGGVFEVADVCAGLRYLISGTIIALLFGYVTYNKNLKRAIFVVATAIVLILANGLRAFIVMFVASATDMRYFAGRDHIYFGWILFGVVVMSLFWIGSRFADEVDVELSRAAANGARQKRGQFLPVILALGLVMLAATARQFQNDFGQTWLLLLPVSGLLFWALFKAFGTMPARSAGSGEQAVPIASYHKVGALAVVLAAGGILTLGPMLITDAADVVSARETEFALPSITGCGSPSSWSPIWRPSFENPDFLGLGTYSCSAQDVNVFVAGYRNNAQGREVATERNQLVPGAWLQFSSASRRRIETDSGDSLSVNELRIEGPGTESLVWYWYAVGDHTTTRPVVVKMMQAYGQLLHGSTLGAVYWIQTGLDREPKSSRQRLAAAARSLEAAAKQGASLAAYGDDR